MQPNMRYYAILMLTILYLFLGPATQAQEPDDLEPPVQSINGFFALQVGVPTKEMQSAIRNNMGNTGIGGALMVLSNPFAWGKNKRNSCLRVGAELGYTYYGRFLTDVNVGGYRGDYKTSYGIMQLNGVIQLRPKVPERVNPFAEILAGGNFYFSSIRENLDAIESALGIQAFDLGGYSSASFNKGVAVGCSFGNPKKHKGAFVTLRVSYNWGSDIKYVERNSLAYNPNSGNLEYSVGRAPVRYFMVQLGIGG